MAPFSSQITFLDFEEYAAGKAFMSRVLGLQNVYDIGWAAVYQTSPGAYLGIIDRPQNTLPRKEGLLISLTADSLEAWHRRIGAYTEVSPIEEVADAGLRSFFFTGPEGYRFEIQQFTADLPRSIFHGKDPDFHLTKSEI